MMALRCLLAVLVLIATALSVPLQTGVEFPGGLQVGSGEELNCSETYVGFLRMVDDQLQLCTSIGWQISTFSSPSASTALRVAYMERHMFCDARGEFKTVADGESGIVQRYCTCDGGFSNNTGGCTAVSAGFYSPPESNDILPCSYGTFAESTGTEECTQCPQNSNTSFIGSAALEDCLCDGGYYATEAGIAVSGCIIAPPNTYSPPLSVSLSSCPSQSSTYGRTGEDSVYGCTCVGGYDRGDGGVECALTPQDYYSPADDSDRYACPAHSTTNGATGGTDITACRCDSGYYASSVGNSSMVCSEAPANTYSPAFSNDLHSCPEHSGTNGTTGRDSVYVCRCDGGYYALGLVTNGCAVSHADHYSPAYENGLTRCPQYSSTYGAVGSMSELDCICHTGYNDTNGDTDNVRTCVDIDECSSDDLNSCGPTATCENWPGYYQCRCSEGFRTNGTHCHDVDECQSPYLNRCEEICENTYGSYECRCAGFGVLINGHMCGDQDGKTAETAGVDCATIRRTYPDAESGVYWVTTVQRLTPFRVYCEMRLAGGGWTLVYANNGSPSMSVKKSMMTHVSEAAGFDWDTSFYDSWHLGGYLPADTFGHTGRVSLLAHDAGNWNEDEYSYYTLETLETAVEMLENRAVAHDGSCHPLPRGESYVFTTSGGAQYVGNEIRDSAGYGHGDCTGLLDQTSGSDPEPHPRHFFYHIHLADDQYRTRGVGGFNEGNSNVRARYFIRPESAENYYIGHAPWNPAVSCGYISRMYPFLGDGYYWVTGSTTASLSLPPVRVYCDLHSADGGWTLYYANSARSDLSPSLSYLDTLQGVRELELANKENAYESAYTVGMLDYERWDTFTDVMARDIGLWTPDEFSAVSFRGSNNTLRGFLEHTLHTSEGVCEALPDGADAVFINSNSQYYPIDEIAYHGGYGWGDCQGHTASNTSPSDVENRPKHWYYNIADDSPTGRVRGVGGLNDGNPNVIARYFLREGQLALNAVDIDRWAKLVESCADVMRYFPFSESGVYRIRNPVTFAWEERYCQQFSDGGGYMLLYANSGSESMAVQESYDTHLAQKRGIEVLGFPNNNVDHYDLHGFVDFTDYTDLRTLMARDEGLWKEREYSSLTFDTFDQLSGFLEHSLTTPTVGCQNVSPILFRNSNGYSYTISQLSDHGGANGYGWGDCTGGLDQSSASDVENHPRHWIYYRSRSDSPYRTRGIGGFNNGRSEVLARIYGRPGNYTFLPTSPLPNHYLLHTFTSDPTPSWVVQTTGTSSWTWTGSSIRGVVSDGDFAAMTLPGSVYGFPDWSNASVVFFEADILTSAGGTTVGLGRDVDGNGYINPGSMDEMGILLYIHAENSEIEIVTRVNDSSIFPYMFIMPVSASSWMRLRLVMDFETDTFTAFYRPTLLPSAPLTPLTAVSRPTALLLGNSYDRSSASIDVPYVWDSVYVSGGVGTSEVDNVAVGVLEY